MVINNRETQHSKDFAFMILKRVTQQIVNNRANNMGSANTASNFC
jgi:hypothetical protein